MIVGVGVALARAERERRAAARARLARRTSLLADEPTAAGLRRVALGQLDLAIELLEGYPGESAERTVHETRKAIKRVRAVMRLVRHELGGQRYEHENAALRDCARRLAGSRDAEVMVGTLDALLRRHPELTAAPSGAGGGVHELRTQLVAERERAAAERDPQLRHDVVADLRAIRERAIGWELRKRSRDHARLPAAGFEDLYRKGRRRLRTAGKRGGIDAMHAWRKRVKDLRYVAETLDRPGAARERKSGRRLRRVARRADRIGEMLGEEHDLALLARAVRKHPKHFAGRRRARKELLAAIERRRKRLRRRALREGERLYRRKPKAFLRRLGDAL